MIDLTPKSQFIRRHGELSLELNQVVTKDWFQEAMTYAIAEMTENGATREQLDGAKIFRETLARLGEPPPEPAIRPDKSSPDWEVSSEDENNQAR